MIWLTRFAMFAVPNDEQINWLSTCQLFSCQWRFVVTTNMGKEIQVKLYWGYSISIPMLYLYPQLFTILKKKQNCSSGECWVCVTYIWAGFVSCSIREIHQFKWFVQSFPILFNADLTTDLWSFEIIERGDTSISMNHNSLKMVVSLLLFWILVLLQS